MARTVHGLQRELLVLDDKGKHVFLVILPVSRLLPQLTDRRANKRLSDDLATHKTTLLEEELTRTLTQSLTC